MPSHRVADDDGAVAVKCRPRLHEHLDDNSLAIDLLHMEHTAESGNGRATVASKNEAQDCGTETHRANISDGHHGRTMPPLVHDTVRVVDSIGAHDNAVEEYVASTEMGAAGVE
jgi:hypothetical protein